MSGIKRHQVSPSSLLASYPTMHPTLASGQWPVVDGVYFKVQVFTPEVQGSNLRTVNREPAEFCWCGTEAKKTS